jgi:hypothetical protein
MTCFGVTRSSRVNMPIKCSFAREDVWRGKMMNGMSCVVHVDRGRKGWVKDED